MSNCLNWQAVLNSNTMLSWSSNKIVVLFWSHYITETLYSFQFDQKTDYGYVFIQLLLCWFCAGRTLRQGLE